MSGKISPGPVDAPRQRRLANAFAHFVGAGWAGFASRTVPALAGELLQSAELGRSVERDSEAPAALWSRTAFVAVSCFVALWLPAAILSRGFVAADGCTHYLYARYCWSHPSNLTDLWGRPFCTALYAIPAVLAGRFGVCAASALVAIACAGISFGIARRQGDRLPVLALIFTLAQPLLFLHSLTAMTELPFAMLLGAAFLLSQKGRWRSAILLTSLFPLARPEGFGFLLLAALTVVWLGKWRWLGPLVAPLVLWDVAGWIINGRPGRWWQWLPAQWPYSAASMYGHGSPLTFVAVLPIVVSPLLLPATLLGIWLSLRARHGELTFYRKLAALVPLSVLAVHSLLYATGKLGSYGEARYLLIAAPFWGVLSGRGWTWLLSRLDLAHPLRWAAAASLAPLVANALHPVVPVRPDPDWAIADRVAAWCCEPSVRERYPYLLCAHPGVFFALDISPSCNPQLAAWERKTILSRPARTLLIWDPIYSRRNATSDRAVALDEVRQAGWVEETTVEARLLDDSIHDSPGTERWHIFASPPR